MQQETLAPAGGVSGGIVLAYGMFARGSASSAPAPEGTLARSWLRFVPGDTARLAVLAAASLVIGGLLNGMRREPLTLIYRSPEQRLRTAVNRLQAPVAAAPSPSPMDLDAFQSFVTAHKGTVIDARAAAFYRLGHVPGAINLPRETFTRDYAGQKAALDQRKAADTAVYCTEADCRDAELVAEALGRLGFRHLWVYQAGWEEWVRAGLPQEGAQRP